MVWVVSIVVVPWSIVIIEVILVMVLLVVHLELAHIDSEESLSKMKSCNRARVGEMSGSDTK
jgi:hypothetical protein